LPGLFSWFLANFQSECQASRGQAPSRFVARITANVVQEHCSVKQEHCCVGQEHLASLFLETLINKIGAAARLSPQRVSSAAYGCV
jgi:hypothetical protein